MRIQTLLLPTIFLCFVGCDAGKVDNQVTINNGQSQDQGQDQEQNDSQVSGTSDCETTCQAEGTGFVETEVCGGAEVKQTEVESCGDSPATLNQPTV